MEPGRDCVESTAVTGDPLPLGVKVADGKVEFRSFCSYRKFCLPDSLPEGETKTWKVFPMKKHRKSLVWRSRVWIRPCYEYNYQIGDQIVVDPYAKDLAGKDCMGEAV